MQLHFFLIFSFILSSCGFSRFDTSGTSAPSSVSAGIVTDRNVIPLPPAPELPAAGGTYTDPAFGTTVMRVTDTNDGNDCQVAYSYWPSFNKDSSRLIVRCNGKTLLYRIDPEQFRIISKEPLFAALTPAHSYANSEDAIWSSLDSKSIYAHDLNKLWSYETDSKKFTLVADIEALTSRGHHINQMSKSDDDNIFAWTEKDADYKNVGYVVYSKAQNRIIYRQATSQIDEVQLDKSGRFLAVKTGNEAAGQIRMLIVDLQTGKVSSLTAGAPDFACGHSDNGSGFIIGGDNFNNTLQFRNLANPAEIRNILSFENDWTQALHVSLLADDPKWAVISTYSKNADAGLFHGEVFQIATDGSGQVRRLAHHRSIFNSYEDSPRANASRDGRFVVYSSNWGKSGFRSVFIVKIPSVPGPAPVSSEPVLFPAGQNMLAVNEILEPGESIVSVNRKFKLTYQTDGNLVVYRNDHTAVWSTGTQGKPGIAIMQSDGNFVIYGSDGEPVWSSDTYGIFGAVLLLLDNGYIGISGNNFFRTIF